MKIVKLSGSQTQVLENLGVDMTADVFLPAGRGAGNYTFCTYCYHQRFEQSGDEAIRVCGNPAVELGISTAQCFWKNRPVKEGSALEAMGVKEEDDVFKNDRDSFNVVNVDGASVSATQAIERLSDDEGIETSTFSTHGDKSD